VRAEMMPENFVGIVYQGLELGNWVLQYWKSLYYKLNGKTLG
jgi:hypothetical protein